jgi:phosphoglycolate phosphatase-like HAD superfamily hydrolase
MASTTINQGDRGGTAVLLRRAEVIFWDFDGVIKDSVAVKADGYERLFAPYGPTLALRVRQHHDAHGGMSRYDKIPTYLGWAGEPATAAKVQDFCERFSTLVLQAVIDSAWVPGVLEYLRMHYLRQHFVLVTATPQPEIQQILQALEISHYFREIHGAPKQKAVAMQDVLRRLACPVENALMVGDSDSDFHAAEANKVVFLLRRTPVNQALQDKHSGPMFEKLNNE